MAQTQCRFLQRVFQTESGFHQRVLDPLRDTLYVVLAKLHPCLDRVEGMADTRLDEAGTSASNQVVDRILLFRRRRRRAGVAGAAAAGGGSRHGDDVIVCFVCVRWINNQQVCVCVCADDVFDEEAKRRQTLRRDANVMVAQDARYANVI